MKPSIALLLPLATSLSFGCAGDGPPAQGVQINESGSGQFKLEAWADNWFSVSLGETLLVEDSVSITTERSFNAEVFSFDATYPMTLNFVLKDYKANDTGLEYIGTDRQQMGDGGFIVQITDTTTNKVVAVSSAAWRCKVIHKAPTNTSCEKDSDPESTCLSEITAEPDGWMADDYDTSSWPTVTEYSEADVGAKDGYGEITWDASAKLIWSSDLETDNTLICKVTVSAP
jgi:hypothetical protein